MTKTGAVLTDLTSGDAADVERSNPLRHRLLVLHQLIGSWNSTTHYHSERRQKKDRTMPGPVFSKFVSQY